MSQPPPALSLHVHVERFPLREPFVIARGAVLEVSVVSAVVTDGAHIGCGECRPYARYAESADAVARTLRSCEPDLRRGMNRAELQDRLPAGAARNALDVALLELESARRGVPPWELLELPAPAPVTTAFTLSLGPAGAMADAARRERERPILKLKLAGDADDAARVAAVRAAAPEARLIVDANEGMRPDQVEARLRVLAELGVALVEQPLPAGEDEVLATFDHPVPVCADESCHTRADLPAILRRYDAVNVKLDKAGGITEAAALLRAAKSAGLQTMVGCMVSTSRAIRPASWLATEADWVDLDAPLLLARDRDPPLRFEGSRLIPDGPSDDPAAFR